MIIKNKKTANIAVVITDPDDWTATAFVTNIRKSGANVIPITLATLSASISDSDSAIFDTDLNDLVALDAIVVRDVGISFALEQISFKFDLLRQSGQRNSQARKYSVRPEAEARNATERT